MNTNGCLGFPLNNVNSLSEVLSRHLRLRNFSGHPCSSEGWKRTMPVKVITVMLLQGTGREEPVDHSSSSHALNAFRKLFLKNS